MTPDRRRTIAVTILAMALLLSAHRPTAATARVTFTTSQPVTLSGKRAGRDEFITGGIVKQCPEARFEGTLRGNSSTLELEPIYGRPVFSGCITKVLGGLRAKSGWMGCTFLLHPIEGSGGDGRWSANVDIRCPSGSNFIWSVYATRWDFKVAELYCTTLMPPQRGLGTAEVANVGRSPHRLAIHWNLVHIKYRPIGSSLLCGPLRAREDASYVGDATIVASDARGHPVDLTISG